jgi:hypothetical protein
MPRKPGRLTKQQLAVEADVQLRDNAKNTLQKFWTAVNNGLDKGDKHAIELVARAFQYDKGPGGVTIFNQHNQITATQNIEATTRVRSFDQIIGKLEEQENAARQNRLLNAPIENSEPDEDDDDDDEILDAEEEAVPVGSGE